MRIQYRKVGNGSDIRKINISITPYGLLHLFYEKVPFWRTTQTNNKILTTNCLSFTNKYTKARLYGTCFVPSWIKIRYMAITCTDKTTGAKNASCVKAIIKTQRYLHLSLGWRTADTSICRSLLSKCECFEVSLCSWD